MSDLDTAGFYKTPDGKTIEIREVWASNLEEEMEIIEEVIQRYPYVAMDTEFPGVVARPNGDIAPNELLYQTLRCNVDLLKIIQLGLTFSDGDGNWVDDGCTCWQFNFKFSLAGDIYAEDSIELLKSCGINFEKFEKDGIDVQYFGELLTMSGLVLSDNVRWISFHSSYDFGYLLKILTCAELPIDEQSFLDLLQIFFPKIFDVKYMMTAVEGLYGGLSSLAETLQVERIGPMHQAGSDSMLTAQTYFALLKKHFGTSFDETKFRGELFGLGSNHTKYKNKSYAASSSTNVTGVSVMRQTGSLNDVQYGAAMSSLSTVHYPSNNGIGTHVGIHQSVGIAGGYQMYEEQNSSIFNSP